MRSTFFCAARRAAAPAGEYVGSRPEQAGAVPAGSRSRPEQACAVPAGSRPEQACAAPAETYTTQAANTFPPPLGLPQRSEGLATRTPPRNPLRFSPSVSRFPPPGPAGPGGGNRETLGEKRKYAGRSVLVANPSLRWGKPSGGGISSQRLQFEDTSKRACRNCASLFRPTHCASLFRPTHFEDTSKRACRNCAACSGLHTAQACSGLHTAQACSGLHTAEVLGWPPSC